MSTIIESSTPEYNETKNTDEKRAAGQFFTHYHISLNIIKRYPTIDEIAKLSGLSPEELKTVTGHLVEKEEGYFNETGGFVLKRYESFAQKSLLTKKENRSGKTKIKPSKTIFSSESQKAGNGNSGDILDNPLIKNYISCISANNSVDAADLLKKLRDNPDITDEKLSEFVKAADVTNVRQHLSPLYDMGIVSLKREEIGGWVTHYWKFNGPENLRNRYISDTQKKIEELEEYTKKHQDDLYFCEEDSSHTPANFADAMEKEFKCQHKSNGTKCGFPMTYNTGDDLKEIADKKIEELRKAIEEVKGINLVKKIEETKQTEA